MNVDTESLSSAFLAVNKEEKTLVKQSKVIKTPPEQFEFSNDLEIKID